MVLSPEGQVQLLIGMAIEPLIPRAAAPMPALAQRKHSLVEAAMVRQPRRKNPVNSRCSSLSAVFFR